MTVDDDNSIYIGGLPYNANEDTLRRVFSIYGSIIAVKIINDNTTRGKCYGFVTFRNPRSVIDAIDDMNGKTIDGRVVRVNGVNSRGGRANFSREHFRYHTEREGDWDRSRGRERDYDHDRDRNRERWHADRSRERHRSRDYDEDRERGYEHAGDHHRSRDDLFDRDRSRDRRLEDDLQEQGRKNDRNRERSIDLGWEQDREMGGINGDHTIVDKVTDQHSRKVNSSTHDDEHSREFSSSDDDYHEVKEQLQRSIKMHNELKNEVCRMEETLETKQQLVSDLQKKTKKLESALISVKKLSSQHRIRLTKLQKCFQQMEEYTNKLKTSEQELQSLVDSAVMDIDMADDIGTRNGILTNGNA